MIETDLIQKPCYWNPDYWQSNPFGNDTPAAEQPQLAQPICIASRRDVPYPIEQEYQRIY